MTVQIKTWKVQRRCRLTRTDGSRWFAGSNPASPIKRDKDIKEN